MSNRVPLIMVVLILLLCVSNTLSAQTPPGYSPQDPPPIAQLSTSASFTVSIDGQLYRAVHVHRMDGSLQSWTCANPRPYARQDSTEIGYACYDYPAAVWLLDALPVTAGPVVVLPSQPPLMAPQPQQQAILVEPPYRPQVTQVVYLPEYRPVIGGVGEVVVVQSRPVYSERVIIARDAIRESGRVLTAVAIRGGSRRR